MARKSKKEAVKPQKGAPSNAHIIGSGEVEQQLITDTLRENYMPYAMSVIVSRAIPDIDGFKPSHRKLPPQVRDPSFRLSQAYYIFHSIRACL